MEKYNGYSYQDVEDMVNANGGPLEYAEGVLIDSMLWYASEYGQYAAAIETALNEWSSGYIVYFGTMEEIYGVWEKATQNAA